MKSTKFKIIKNTFYEKGSKRSEFFTVKRKIKFLFWDIWLHLSEESYDGRDKMRFDTEGEAMIAIKRCQMGIPMDGWKEEVVLEIDFNKDNKSYKDGEN